MSRRRTISPRWLVVVLVAALTGSAVVVWALVHVTGRTDAELAGASGSAPATTGRASSVPTADPTSASPVGSVSSPGSSVPGHATRSGAATPLTEPAPALPGSQITVPAAWSGTADLTITVNGECAGTGGTSSYAGLATDLALQAPVTGSGPFDDPNPYSLTLGVTPAAIPGLSLLSAEVDENGTVRRTWWIAAGSDPAAADHTVLSGALIADQPVGGSLPPNLLADNETDLLPCQRTRAAGGSRTLAAGASLSGWVSPTAAVVDVTGTTTDGERTITLHAELHRIVPSGS